MRQKVAVVTLIFALILGTSAAGELHWKDFDDGLYLGTVPGMWGNIGVEVKLVDGAIASIDVVEGRDDLYIHDDQLETFISSIIDQQSLNVDMVTGATVDCEAILAAIYEALVKEDPIRPWSAFGDGIYEGLASGMWGDIGVAVTLEDGRIVAVEITEGRDDMYIYDDQLEEFIGSIIAEQRLDVDVVTGATVDCETITAAIFLALDSEDEAEQP